MTQANKYLNHAIYHRVLSPLPIEDCLRVSDYFYRALKSDSPSLKKSHFFHGRYENIYLKEVNFEPLEKALQYAKQAAADCLSCSPDELSMDFWFNNMPPSHITDWHRHDVMDEQLSGVYYLSIPNNSGHLLIKNKQAIERVKPKENDMVFFNPDVEHYVEENKSNQSRLSIGMNFGFVADKL